MKRLLPLLLLVPVAVAATCQSGGTGPTLEITLNGIPASMSDLLVVPRSGFVVNLTFTPGPDPIDPTSLRVSDTRWGDATLASLEFLFEATPTGAVATIPSAVALEPGTHTLYALIRDEQGRTTTSSLSFAVRDFASGIPPIGQGQQIWLDFESDRDATPGADFAVDLQSFGLGSPAAPAVSGDARDLVVEAALARIREAYGQDADGLGEDAVAVAFTDQPPAAGDVTRICVGGEDPSGGSTVGSIQIDPNNAARNSVECGTIPPTGVFPRELLGYQSQGWFHTVFDPVMPAAGGIPIGESPWDSVVLDPAFDPGSADPDAAARYAVVMAAIDAFAKAIGSVIAHEAGHALGLVPPGAPGGGLFGGGDGVSYAHSLNPDGSTPGENFLMKAGNTFSFAKLAGLGSYPLPVFRPIELAYLHDRVVLAPQVTELLPPPTLASVTPWQITGSSQLVTILGDGLAVTPAVRLLSSSYTYSALGEAWQSAQQMTCWVIPGQLPVGTYDLELTNPDGQKAVLPSSVRIY